MTAPAVTTLDLLPALQALEGALELGEAVHRTRTPVDPDRGPLRRNDPALAELSRDLLRAADLAAMAEAELRERYWQLKGYDDPRGT